MLGALFTDKAWVPEWLMYVIAADIVVHGLSVIILEIYSRMMDKTSTPVPDNADTDPSGSKQGNHVSHTGPCQGFLLVMVWWHNSLDCSSQQKPYHHWYEARAGPVTQRVILYYSHVIFLIIF